MNTQQRVERAARALAARGPVTIAAVARAARVTWPTANRWLGGQAGLATLLGREPPSSVRSRERLLDAAAACVAEHGVEATSLDLLAERAGLTKGAVYWHFESKTALIEALVERLATRPLSAEARPWVSLWASARGSLALAASRRTRAAALDRALGAEGGAVLRVLLDGLEVACWLGDGALPATHAAWARGLSRVAEHLASVRA